MIIEFNYINMYVCGFHLYIVLFYVKKFLYVCNRISLDLMFLLICDFIHMSLMFQYITTIKQKHKKAIVNLCSYILYIKLYFLNVDDVVLVHNMR